MAGTEGEPENGPVNHLFETLDVPGAVETEEFRVFLDHVPMAIVIARATGGGERIVYANKAFEALMGLCSEAAAGKDWSILNSFRSEEEPQVPLSEALPQREDFTGCFRRDQPHTVVEVYSGLIDNDDAGKTYHIVALIDVTGREAAQRGQLSARLRDKDMLLKELQHRVKNNLQLITALIRLEARSQRAGDQVNLERLTGRIEAMYLLYKDLQADGFGKVIDLGHYVSQIASAMMHAYGAGNVRLDLKVDHVPVSVNIAMPVGLLVNELLTNSFKYAFHGRDSGTILLRCLRADDDACRLVVADDGVGFPSGVSWPVPGKLGALILQSLRENTATDVAVESSSDHGVRVTLSFCPPSQSPKPN
jgi:PAS domain S-box-containing protein